MPRALLRGVPRARLRVLIAAAVATTLVITGLIVIRSASADTPPRRIVNGWLPYWTMAQSLNAATQNADLWSSASPFWYEATGATTITNHPGAGDQAVVDALRSRGIAVVPTVTESLNAPAMATLLGNASQRAAHVQALVNLVTSNGYDGIDLDYESMNFGGTSTDRLAVRTRFVTLVAELNTALNNHGKVLSVTVGPRTRPDDPSWLVFDYAGIAPAADRVRIMTYDYHWRGGSPGAVAPLTWVNQVLTYAVTAIPAGKIEAGVPLYGYDWPADATQPDGYGNATSTTYADAEALRVQRGAARQWSAVDAAPYFSYTAPNDVRHLVWYNDADSTKAKMALIQKYGLRGLVFWAVAEEDTRHWPPLRAYAIQRSVTVTAAVPGVTTYGSAVTVTGKLTAAGTGTPIAGRPVLLLWQAAGSTTWSYVATGSTSSTGTVALKYTPPANGSFRLVSYSSWEWLSGASTAAATLVRWRVSAAFTDNTVTRGTRVYLRGSVAPIRTGTPVQLQRLVNGVWQSATTRTTVASNGTYAFSFVWPISGTYTYRVVVPATALNSAATSPNLLLYVS